MRWEIACQASWRLMTRCFFFISPGGCGRGGGINGEIRVARRLNYYARQVMKRDGDCDTLTDREMGSCHLVIYLHFGYWRLVYQGIDHKSKRVSNPIGPRTGPIKGPILYFKASHVMSIRNISASNRTCSFRARGVLFSLLIDRLCFSR